MTSRQQLSREFPANPQYDSTVADLYDLISQCLELLGQSDRAALSEGRARDLRERLARENPDVPDYRHALGNSWIQSAIRSQARGQLEDALALFRRAAEAHNWALTRHPDHPTYRLCQINAFRGVAATSRALRRPEDLATAAREWTRLVARRPADHAEAARWFSAAIPLSAPDDPRTRHGDEAMAALRRAIAAGWGDWPLAASDPDLRPLHDRRDFQQLVFDRLVPADPFARGPSARNMR